MSRVFVSYASPDRGFIWQAMASLRRSGAEVWDYTRVGDGIPPGSDIAAYLEKRVREAHVFLACVTRHSLDPGLGRWAQAETLAALDQLGQGHKDYAVIPVVDRAAPLPTFVEPYSRLINMFRVELDSSNPEVTETAVRRLCEEIRIGYVPPAPDRSVILRNRFHSELRDKEARGVLISPAQRIELEGIVDFCNAEMEAAAPDWQRILDGVTAFLFKARREQLGDWYYPLALKGLCHLELGDLVAAQGAFRAAVAHPSCDEHAWGGLGFVYFQLGQTDDAIACLNRALELSRHKGWELKVDILSVLRQSGQRVDVESAITGVDLAPLSVPDWVKLMNLRGASLVDHGQFESARRILTQVVERKVDGESVADDVAVIHLAAALRSLGRGREAVEILKWAAERLKDANLYHHWASLLWDLGRESECFQVFETLRGQSMRRRRYAIGYARRLHLVSDFRKMKILCHEVLDHSLFGLPQSAEEFWFCGFAHYLLGNSQLAEYDRVRGQSYCSTPYARI